MPHSRTSVAVALAPEVRAAILRAYRAAGWNTTHAAEKLGVNRRTLLRWVERHDLRDELNQARETSNK